VHKLHCFSHTITAIDDVPPGANAFAQLAVGDDISLVGIAGDGREPWRIALQGSTAPTVLTMDTAVPVAERPPQVVVESTRATESVLPLTERGGGKWREAIATLGAELARGESPEIPLVPVDTELGTLAHRLGLSAMARRALVALYALHLVGEAAVPLARLAAIVGDWPEALGQGDLGALALLRKKAGRVRLRRVVTDMLDGTPPRHVRLTTGAPAAPKAGAWRVSREGRTDAEIEAALTTQLGRLAMVEGDIGPALLEARLHGATAVTTSVPEERPRPWPRDAGLVLVLYGTQSAWVADVPALP
jgi:hypothetical protein